VSAIGKLNVRLGKDVYLYAKAPIGLPVGYFSKEDAKNTALVMTKDRGLSRYGGTKLPAIVGIKDGDKFYLSQVSYSERSDLDANEVRLKTRPYHAPDFKSTGVKVFSDNVAFIIDAEGSPGPLTK